MADFNELLKRVRGILGEAGKPHSEEKFNSAFQKAAREFYLEEDSYKPFGKAARKALIKEGFIGKKLSGGTKDQKKLFSPKTLQSLIAQSRAHERRHVPYNDN